MQANEHISPTAHYTGYVWYRNKLGLENLSTQRGSLYYHGLMPFDKLISLFNGGMSLENYLLQRHKIIDHLLEEQIRQQNISQVVEIAAGISARGRRFATKYPHLTYIETDLPAMLATKQELIREKYPPLENHKFEVLDALQDDYLAKLQGQLDTEKGLAVITEGLIGYFNRAQAEKAWQNIFTFLNAFNKRMYLSDIHIAEHNQGGLIDFFKGLLGRFVKSAIELPFKDDQDTLAALKAAGAESAKLHNPASFYEKLDIPQMQSPSVLRILQAFS